MTRPTMRGSQLHANLVALQTLGAPEAEAIRAVAPDAVRDIEAAIAVAWLPIELDVALTDAVVEVVGHDRMRAWASEAILESTRGPLLGPITRTLVAMGMTPASPLHRVPLGWPLVYRNCGEVTAERVDEHTVLLQHIEPPRAMSLSVTYREGIAGTFEGLMKIGGAERAHVYLESEPRLGYRCVFS